MKFKIQNGARFFKNGLLAAVILTSSAMYGQPNRHDPNNPHLAQSWDEAIPLGNGMLGALIWEKEGRLHLSLDRADLWDLRPMKGLHRKEFSYSWIEKKVREKDYSKVQQFFDEPYDREPAPTKIPGAGLEMESQGWGKVESTHLSLDSAQAEVKWSNGVQFKTFVHASLPFGFFRLQGVPGRLRISLIPPPYQGKSSGIKPNSLVGDDLSRLGYPPGSFTETDHSILYVQKGWGGFEYRVMVEWHSAEAGVWEGWWNISSTFPKEGLYHSDSTLPSAPLEDYSTALLNHLSWWQAFWSQSSIWIPDSLLEKQWYWEMYKLGSLSRAGAPPISLQGVWTADNGRIPPWKGDFHHDLNTELSYWPCYSSNHLTEALPFLQHLDDNQANYRRYTQQFYGKPGLAVPGVTTLDGTEMGGWVQYSLSPTVSAWLAQHFYLQWRYSMDSAFLKREAYPWMRQVASFLESMTFQNEKGIRTLPMSSSPEINDNSLNAWFSDLTNYDLALIKFVFSKTAELADIVQDIPSAAHWRTLENELPPFALTDNDVLKFAPTQEYNQSHRHFSNALAIHPLGIIQWEQGAHSQSIITHTLHALDSVGPGAWCGYSYSWLANLKARARDGAGAAQALQIFAKAFCLPNGFHANGDQTHSGYSGFTYRPFTLEGNFAFAAGLQEMLLQSYSGTLEILPAIPTSWKNLSFHHLRAEGAFLVDVTKSDGQVTEVRILSEKGGTARLKLPFKTWYAKEAKGVNTKLEEGGILSLQFERGGEIQLVNGYE